MGPLRQPPGAAVILLDGKVIVRVWAKHDPEPGHLRDVIEDMLTLGPPTVRCVEWRGEYYAIEGSHRLRAAFELGLAPTLVVLQPDRLTGDDEAFWEGLKLSHYAWQSCALFEFNPGSLDHQA